MAVDEIPLEKNSIELDNSYRQASSAISIPILSLD